MGTEKSYVNIEYLTWPIIRYKREVLFGWVDLLVSFGGIAGLFLGFSLLSGVEIIYYFTMRACCMLYKNRVSKQNKYIQNIFHSLAFGFERLAFGVSVTLYFVTSKQIYI